MERQGEFSVAETAPVTGTYELLNAAGTSTIVRVPVFQGAAFPAAPPGWAWRFTGRKLPPD
jgi:hypothetical protein